MIPYFLILPLWYLVAVAWPVMESLHALRNKSPEALSSKKMWLCYWVLFVGCSWVYHYFEWLLSIPFYVLSFYVDIYFEAQLILAAALVLPKFLLVKKVH